VRVVRRRPSARQCWRDERVGGGDQGRRRIESRRAGREAGSRVASAVALVEEGWNWKGVFRDFSRFPFLCCFLLGLSARGSTFESRSSFLTGSHGRPVVDLFPLELVWMVGNWLGRGI
jgi:hypothetical protein